MRKILLILLIFPVLFFISDFSKATNIGVPLGESELYSMLTLKSGNLLKDAVILPEKEFDGEEAANIIKRLDLLPKSILSDIKKNGIKIILFEGKLTDQPYVEHLKGKVPRGYPETVLWDDLPGAGGSQYVFVKIGSSEKGKGHGSVNLEYHELAHSLQRFSYNDDKTDKELTEVWKQEASSLFPKRDYFLDYKEEYFAECFAYYFYSEHTREQLKVKAPKMYTFLNSLQ
ncbi:anthrax toxin lethal factor-related metalloendopeptidase [Siminovitchia fortis]|uniref:anthrax toxin lethal factor-related metalloendopeptidase n=1 Tax=Siminovitchia fortis TaxID=254758 RepID=UPI00119F4105|nr:toxin [Siminovitchia fortis]